MNLPTKHLFHDSTCTPDFPAFFILMWLTHHFLSTSTVKASVVRTLISHCYGKRKGKARKGLRETLAPSRRSPRGTLPQGRQVCRPHVERAPHTKGSQSHQLTAQSKSREALPSSSSALSAKGRNPGDQNSTCVQAHTHTQTHTARARVPTHTRAHGQSSGGLCTPICIIVHFQAEQHVRSVSADLSRWPHTAL